MTTPATPFLSWKELYDRTETFWTQPLQTLLGTDSAVGWMSLTRENALTQHQVSKEALEATWESLRLPSKGDHARLAAQVVAVEAKVEAVEDRLERLESKLDTLIGLLADTDNPKRQKAKQS